MHFHTSINDEVFIKGNITSLVKIILQTEQLAHVSHQRIWCSENNSEHM